MVSKPRPTTRHVISINDLSNKDIESIFEIAEAFLHELPDPNVPYRIARSTNLAPNSILASLFYEPSTRTRLSFESAMLRLGGDFITSADPATSSAAKGESLADSVRVIANYADILVIRHPRDGAAKLAAEYSPIPVINGGDGGHEHPTQTLCDLFTLKRKNKSLKNLKVAISGDLRGSRTIHSFVYALARFGANIDADAGQGHGAAGARRPAAARGIPLQVRVERLDRRALRDARRAAPAIAVLRARDRPRHQRHRAEDRRGVRHPLPEGTLGREGSGLSEDRRQVPRRAEIFRRQRSASRCRASASSTPRSIPTAARSISSRRPMACRCAWR